MQEPTEPRYRIKKKSGAGRNHQNKKRVLSAEERYKEWEEEISGELGEESEATS